MEADRGKKPNITFADVFENANFPKNINKIFEACMPKMTEGESFGTMIVFGTSNNSEAGQNFYKQLWEKQQ